MAFNPYFFCDSPLPMELIYKAIRELDFVTPTVEELKKKVDKLVNDLDAGIKDEVAKVIQEMYDNGELDAILEAVAEEYLENLSAPKAFKVDTRRQFRVCLEAQTYQASTIDQQKYSYCQGGHYFKKNDVSYYVGCYKPSRKDNLYYKNDNADIRLYTYLDGGWHLVRHNVYSVGHANDIKYIEEFNQFFVVHSAEFNSGSNETGCFEISVIDWDMPSQPDWGVRFESEDFPMLAHDRLTCIDYYDGKFWLFIGSGSADNPVQIYTVPELSRDAEITLYKNVYMPYASGTSYTMIGAGFCQNDEYIFIGNTAPAGIYRYNKATQKLDCFYEIGSYTNDHMFPVGEFENLSIVDDILYIGTSIHANQRYWNYDYNQVFAFDYINNLTVPSACVTAYGGLNRIIYVGDTNHIDEVNANIKEISNPNGLTGTGCLPFPTLSEAIQFANAQNYWNEVEIDLITQWLHEYVVIDCGGKTIYINGKPYYDNNTESGVNHYVRLGGVFCTGSNVSIAFACIQNRNPDDDRVPSAYRNWQFSSFGGVVSLYACPINVYARPVGNQLFSVDRCFANFNNLYDNNMDSLTYGADDVTLRCCSVNTFGHWTGSESTAIIG